MKTRYILVIAFIFTFIVSIWKYNTDIAFENKTMKYHKAIEIVYSSDIDGMAVVIFKSSNLHGKENRIYSSAVGSKKDNFSENSEDGVKLWATKQLFLSLNKLNIVRKGLPEIIAPEEREFYVIQTNYDYSGDNKSDIYHLGLFVDSKNYHVFIPESYYDPNKLMDLSTEYIEYEPNEITKNLINSIIKLH